MQHNSGCSAHVGGSHMLTQLLDLIEAVRIIWALIEAWVL